MTTTWDPVQNSLKAVGSFLLSEMCAGSSARVIFGSQCRRCSEQYNDPLPGLLQCNSSCVSAFGSEVSVCPSEQPHQKETSISHSKQPARFAEPLCFHSCLQDSCFGLLSADVQLVRSLTAPKGCGTSACVTSPRLGVCCHAGVTRGATPMLCSDTKRTAELIANY